MVESCKQHCQLWQNSGRDWEQMAVTSWLERLLAESLDTQVGNACAPGLTGLKTTSGFPLRFWSGIAVTSR